MDLQKLKFELPQAKFKRLFSNQKQLWYVVYLKSSISEAIEDTKTALENGADIAIIEGKNFSLLDEALGKIIKLFPKEKIGTNFLGPDSNLHTYKETFQLAQKYQLQVSWTDFSGVDLINEAPEVSLHDIELHRPKNSFYVSGIHMKYSTLIDPRKSIEQSALQAMGWVDGIILTGGKTGEATDLDKIQRTRSVIGSYPLGLASGVTEDNIHNCLPYIDFVIVNSGVSNPEHRPIAEKIKNLKLKMS